MGSHHEICCMVQLVVEDGFCQLLQMFQFEALDPQFVLLLQHESEMLLSPVVAMVDASGLCAIRPCMCMSRVTCTIDMHAALNSCSTSRPSGWLRSSTQVRSNPITEELIVPAQFPSEVILHSSPAR